LEHLPASE